MAENKKEKRKQFYLNYQENKLQTAITPIS